MKFKNKLVLSLLSFCIIFTFVIPTLSLAFDKDSVYVWSNFSSETASIVPSQEEQEENSENGNRKFSRHYFWKCSINGSKSRKSSLCA